MNRTIDCMGMDGLEDKLQVSAVSNMYDIAGARRASRRRP